MLYLNFFAKKQVFAALGVCGPLTFDRKNLRVRVSCVMCPVTCVIIFTLKSGSLSRFMQVEAVGRRARSGPELAMQKGGYKSWN